MSDFIDDEIVEAACKAITLSKREWMRLPLQAALPLIGEKLAKQMGFLALGQAAAHIRELTGAKP